MNNVAFLCHPYHRGGVTLWMANAAKEMALQGVETYFITVQPTHPFISSGGRKTMISLVQEGEIRNLKLITTKVDFLFELGTEEYRASVYEKLIRDHLPAGTPIIVSDDPSVWRGVALLAQIYPLISVIHSSVDHGYFNLTQQYQKFISTIICVSERTKANLVARVPGLKQEVHVIPCGIPLAEFMATGSENQTDSSLRIIWTGRLEEMSKRISDISKIALALKEKKISFTIEVIGSGVDEDKLIHDIQRQNLQDLITLAGWQETRFIIQAYKRSDLLLQTSNYEGMSVAVMEALASGCGVVSTRVSGVEDYENSQYAKQCMRLYEVGNITEAVKRIEQITQIPIQERKASAKAFAEQSFSISSCVRQYKSVLQLVLPVSEAFKSSNNGFLMRFKSHKLAILRKIKYYISH